MSAPYGHQQPITQQPVPAAGIWMPVPAAIPNCPPGLEYLTQIDQILCHQKVELLEAFTGWETENKYVLKNSMGQQVYYAFEQSDMCMRQCCHQARAFDMHIVNNFNQEVIKVRREFKCCAGCCWCAGACLGCAHELVVESPPGNIIGSVIQTGSACTYNYAIRDASNNTQLRIEGPCLMCRCCADVEFPVYSLDGQKVGNVTKQWSGLIREAFTDADNFGISFPLNLDVKMKATLLGAMFLIDFMAFEDNDRYECVGVIHDD